jgi:hypothetical protein
VAIGSFDIDTLRFPPAGPGRYTSPDYDTAANKIDLSVEGGVGKVRIA